jgi:hypothetical protein
MTKDMRRTVQWQTPHLGIEVTIDNRHTGRTDFRVEANSAKGLVEGIDRIIEALRVAQHRIQEDS